MQKSHRVGPHPIGRSPKYGGRYHDPDQWLILLSFFFMRQVGPSPPTGGTACHRPAMWPLWVALLAHSVHPLQPDPGPAPRRQSCVFHVSWALQTAQGELFTCNPATHPEGSRTSESRPSTPLGRCLCNDSRPRRAKTPSRDAGGACCPAPPSCDHLRVERLPPGQPTAHPDRGGASGGLLVLWQRAGTFRKPNSKRKQNAPAR